MNIFIVTLCLLLLIGMFSGCTVIGFVAGTAADHSENTKFEKSDSDLALPDSTGVALIQSIPFGEHVELELASDVVVEGSFQGLSSIPIAKPFIILGPEPTRHIALNEVRAVRTHSANNRWIMMAGGAAIDVLTIGIAAILAKNGPTPQIDFTKDMKWR